MTMQKMKKIVSLMLAAGMLLSAQSVLAEEAIPVAEEAAQVAQEEAAPAAEDTVQAVAGESIQTEADTAAQTDAAALEQKLNVSYTLALNAINKEDYETAKKYLNICFVYCDPQTYPTVYADLLLKQACIEVIEGENDMALMLLDAALTVQPDLADAYLVKTQIHTNAADFAKAVESLEKYVELTGDTAMYETIAELYAASSDTVSAQTAYDKYLEGAGAEVEAAAFQAGLYRMENGQYEDAIKAFEGYTEKAEYSAGAWYNIGICRMNMGDYAPAYEAFTKSIENGGAYNGIYYNRGICALMTEKWAEGEADMQKSVETESYVSDALYNLGICQMQQEKYEEAVATFTTLIGDGEGADATAEKAPVSDSAYYFRGVCNGALGNLEAALADYTVCIEHGYDLAQSYYQRAQIYAAMGDTEKQNSDLENSLKESN